jgi:hypothetical protein
MMRKRVDIHEQHPEKKSTISYSMDVEVSEILDNDLPSESALKRTKYGTLWTAAFVSLRPLRMPQRLRKEQP